MTALKTKWPKREEFMSPIGFQSSSFDRAMKEAAMANAALQNIGPLPPESEW
jgi:hypothetical protein